MRNHLIGLSFLTYVKPPDLDTLACPPYPLYELGENLAIEI